MILRNTGPVHDPYALAARALGIQPSAGENEIRTAYRKAAHHSHPDLNRDKASEALLNARFRLATAARSLLLARAGNQDVRPLLKDFQAAQQWYDQEAKKAGVTESPAPPPTGQAAPKAQPAADPTSARGPQWQSTTSGNSEAFKNAKSWVPPEFNSDDARTYRSSQAGRHSSTSEEARNARAWTPPDLDELKRQQAAADEARAKAAGPPPGAAAPGGTSRTEEAKAAPEKPRAASQAGSAFQADDWNLGGASATAGAAPKAEPKVEPQPEPQAQPEAAPPPKSERPPMSEAEAQWRKARVSAYGAYTADSHLGRHVNLEV